MDLAGLATGLLWPLSRLVLSVSISLLVANLIETFNWTRFMAKLAAPLVRLSRLKDISGASFSLAFFSSLAANTMLAEAFDQGRLTRRELILSNLFNSLPTYFLHLPTMIFLTVSLLGQPGYIYVGLTLIAAFLRSSTIVVLGRLFLPPLPEGCVVCQLPADADRSWRTAADKAWQRFKRRLPKILFITIPTYILIYFLNRSGAFGHIENFLAAHAGDLAWLDPKAVTVVAFQIAAESSAGLAAAGALLTAGSLPVKSVVLALLVGNIVSTPVRALRHQFPAYAGIFKPALAANLILASQTFRAASIFAVALGYWLLG